MSVQYQQRAPRSLLSKVNERMRSSLRRNHWVAIWCQDKQPRLHSCGGLGADLAACCISVLPIAPILPALGLSPNFTFVPSNHVPPAQPNWLYACFLPALTLAQTLTLHLTVNLTFDLTVQRTSQRDTHHPPTLPPHQWSSKGRFLCTSSKRLSCRFAPWAAAPTAPSRCESPPCLRQWQHLHPAARVCRRSLMQVHAASVDIFGSPFASWHHDGCWTL